MSTQGGNEFICTRITIVETVEAWIFRIKYFKPFKFIHLLNKINSLKLEFINILIKLN